MQTLNPAQNLHMKNKSVSKPQIYEALSLRGY